VNNIEIYTIYSRDVQVRSRDGTTERKSVK